jgi:hypothetical protein
MFIGGAMVRGADMSSPIPGLIPLDMVERPVAARRRRPTVCSPKVANSTPPELCIQVRKRENLRLVPGWSMSEPSARSASTSRLDTPSRKFNPQTRVDFSATIFSFWANYAARRQKNDSNHAVRAFQLNRPAAFSFVQLGQ